MSDATAEEEHVGGEVTEEKEPGVQDIGGGGVEEEVVEPAGQVDGGGGVGEERAADPGSETVVDGGLDKEDGAEVQAAVTGGPGDNEHGAGEEERKEGAKEKEEEEDISSSPAARSAGSFAVVSIDDDPLLDESSAYAAAELVRALQPWEISRDHLVFGDMCGLDQGKRHFIHVIEPPVSGQHGGVVLTAAGNTVQLLTLAESLDGDQVCARASNVAHRRYLFGTSGGGIGALAVHPSRRFFAVAEKGVKPAICVYQYPSARVCRVLRNGTELAYSSASFSADGETLASVGSAPDFLLTVWHWRAQQTVLRCKAFGQDVFSVRFAPLDAGFLATSGVGHIRFWKMASTFTGLKLQGDIGKFGKSELSDIEAFCVLPDKKVLSGTERGVLLLWDGPFIKCEILTSRRHAPHAGRVHVVQFEPERQQIVTAGSDGAVKFWSLDAIDKADVQAEETVALVPMARQVVVAPQLDIRAVARCGDHTYLVQSADGGIHWLRLLDGPTGLDGQAYEVVLDYVANPTGRATGLVCSPYEHLAVSCGANGSVHAWDYVACSCLFSASTTVAYEDLNDGSSVEWTAAATAIAWVPNVAATTVPSASTGVAAATAAATSIATPTATATAPAPATRSRQVLVGFDDGLVRVLLLDLSRQVFVRTNVFKPHSARVSAVGFSHSGRLVATASVDATFFLFQVAPCAPRGAFATPPHEYVPLGFQRVAGAVRSLEWREDDRAVLVTTAAGAVVEFEIPVDGSLESLAARRSPSDDASAASGVESASETFDLSLASRSFSTLQRLRPLTIAELAALEALGSGSPGHAQVDDAVHANFQSSEGSTTALQVCAASYYTQDTLLLSVPSAQGGGGGGAALVLAQWNQTTPPRELATEPTSPVVALARSPSRKFVLAALANGKFQVRTTPQPRAFLTGEFHDGGGSAGSTGSGSGSGSGSDSGDAPLRPSVALSFDDSFVVVSGADGNVSVSRLHGEKMELAARLLDEKYETALAEAAIAGEQAQEKQKMQLDVLRKAAADEAKRNGDDSGVAASAAAGGATSGTEQLNMLPSFHRAKAFAACWEAQLRETDAAKDDELFRGVVRLVTDANSTLGLPLAVAASSVLGADGGAASLALLEVPDIANPREAYTIEDAKRKSEADARARATRSKQDRTRDVLEQMRRSLRELQALDASYAPENRLDEGEWEVDLDYGELLAQRGDAACDEVKRELAFAVKREELLLLKMREAYVSQLAVEQFTVHAFASGLCVQSFRTTKMSSLLQKRLHEIHLSNATSKRAHGSSDSLAVHGAAAAGAGAAVGMVPRRPSVLHIMAKEAELDDAFPLEDGERQLIQRGSSLPAPPVPVAVAGHHAEPAASTGASVHGFEARKRLRADRKARLQAWLGSRPGEHADDPRDLVAIAFAQRNMGDYKLKTAPAYVVPEAQRVNAAKKRRQMALLEEQLYTRKLHFNAKVLELRELKLLLLQDLRRDQAREAALQRGLGQDAQGGEEGEEEEKLPLSVDWSEWPEQRERVSEEDIAHFLADRSVRPHAVASVDVAMAVGVDGVAAAEPHMASGRRRSSVGAGHAVDRSIAAVSRRIGVAESGTLPRGDAVVGTVRHVRVDESHDHAVDASEPHTAAATRVDADERAIRVHLMQQELQRLRRRQREEISAYDDAVAHLRREKMRLDVAFKQCELKLLTLLSELVLLEQFESRENLLSSKLEKSRSDKALVVAELHDIQESMGAKKKEVEEWGKQEKAVQAEFLGLVSGGGGGGGANAPHPNIAALQKIFKRKIKRPKKKAAGAGKDGGAAAADGADGGPPHSGDGAARGEEEEDDDDDEDDDSDFGDDDDEDDDDDDDDDDVCPPGCELQLYEKVLALRERRADVDDATSELAKAVDELRKSSDRHVARQRQIDKELQATEQDIQAFQSEKQTRFNQLDVVLALSKQQIRCLSRADDGRGAWRLPEQASGSLVFPLAAFGALAERIESLQRENRSLRQQFRDLHKQQSVLAKDKRLQQETIARIQQKCEQLQLLKFGQLIDLELLDKACDATNACELQAKVRVKEMETERELARVKLSQTQIKRQILEATEHNTALLGRIAALNARQLELEKQLNHATVGQTILQDESEDQEREMRERNKLVKIVKLQAREVEALKQEIGLLRGKDGKVYAPRS